MTKKVPIVLITGFLGSGKTSYIANFLSFFSKEKRIAIIQNEFAQSNVDSEILKENDNNFILKEINKGSIFCSCLFGCFKDTLAELANNDKIDIVLVEATGVADPIAVAQVMDDKRVSDAFYLKDIVTLVDGSRFLNVLENITSVKHQVEVADTVIVNKIDLIDNAIAEDIKCDIKQINPFAKLYFSKYGKLKKEEIYNTENESLVSKDIKGELTKCGQGHYISKIFKTTMPISKTNVNDFIKTLDEDILRLKGYITDKDGDSFFIQFVPGQSEIIKCKSNLEKSELISIGFKEPNFNMLQTNN